MSVFPILYHKKQCLQSLLHVFSPITGRLTSWRGVWVWHDCSVSPVPERAKCSTALPHLVPLHPRPSSTSPRTPIRSLTCPPILRKRLWRLARSSEVAGTLNSATALRSCDVTKRSWDQHTNMVSIQWGSVPSGNYLKTISLHFIFN